jgi:hypothetical protein
LTSHDFADPRCRYVNGLGQPVLADAERLKKLLIEQFTRGWAAELSMAASFSPLFWD